ncbi:MAG: hypothetical protein H6612_08230 [Ignavibacteriales bacterium]|nr:hypothetical protein [Ignavibacteriales bacterium]
MSYTINDFIGNIGVFLIIFSYLLLQLKKIDSSTLMYSLMNLIGASLVIISLLENFNVSAFIIEAFWVAISLIGIVKNFSKPKLSN